MPENLRVIKDLPIIGDYVTYERDRLGFLTNSFHTYGPVVRYSEFVYMLAESSLCEQVLLRTNQDFFTPNVESIAGLTNFHYDMEQIVEQWKTGRIGIVKGLHARTISPHFEQMVNIIASSLATWKAGQVIAVFEEMRQLASRLTVNYLFGPRGYAYLKTFHQYVDAHFDWLNSPFAFPAWLPTPLSLRWQAKKKRLAQALHALIRQEHAHPSESPNLLLLVTQTPDPRGKPFSDEHIQGVMTAMLFQSAHTSFASLSWIWFLLASHPEQEEKMYLEIQRVLGDRHPEQHDLSRLLYTEGVIKETLRLYPPLWQLTRDVTRSCRLDDYVCEEGQRLYLNLYSVHHDPRFFTEPDLFQPERWLHKEEGKAGTRGNYMPFGLGPRKCLGSSFAMTEMLLITIMVARHFKLHLDDAVKARVSPDIVLRPKNLRLRLEKR